MDINHGKEKIVAGQVALGIELGSTRIKAVLVTNDFQTVASGDFNWENKLVNNIWTYPVDEIWQGIQSSYKEMADNVQSTFGVSLKNIGSIGISA